MRIQLFKGIATTMLVVSAVLFMAVGYAGKERTDGAGQGRHGLEAGGGTAAEEPRSDRVIPNAEAGPMSADSYFNSGMACNDQGQFELAIADFTNVLSADPNDLFAYFYRGFAYFRLEQYELAIADYTKSISLDPDFCEAYVSRGSAYGMWGEYSLAVRDYTKAVQLDPGNSIAYGYRALAYIGQGQYDLAIADCTLLIEREPDQADPYMNRGFAYESTGQYSLAVRDYTKAIQLEPRNALAYYDRGNVWFSQGQYGLAIADYTLAMERDPDYEDLYINRGVAYENLGQYEPAIDDYSKAIELSPGYALAYENRANALEAAGDGDAAARDRQKAEEVRWSVPHTYAQDTPADTPATAAPSSNREPKTIAVSTAEELVDAIGSNTVIVLSNGVYNLSEIHQGAYSTGEKSWEDVYDGKELWIENVHNLTIKGESAGCEIVTDPRGANVLSFYKCTGITLENITAGHTLRTGSCEGGVFHFEDCSDIRLTNTHMFGCGTMGLGLFSVSGAKVEDSSVYECTERLLYIWDSDRVSFANCIFRDAEFLLEGVTIYDAENITFDHCEFINIRLEDLGMDMVNSLFDVEESLRVAVNNTRFINNQGRSLDPSGLVSFENNTFSGNSFEENE